MRNAPDITMIELFGSTPELLSDQLTMKKLRTIVEESIRAQELLVARFETRQLGPTEFQSGALREHQNALAKIKIVIGVDRFYQLFGEEADHPEFVADPEPFFKAFGR